MSSCDSESSAFSRLRFVLQLGAALSEIPSTKDHFASMALRVFWLTTCVFFNISIYSAASNSSSPHHHQGYQTRPSEDYKQSSITPSLSKIHQADEDIEWDDSGGINKAEDQVENDGYNANEKSEADRPIPLPEGWSEAEAHPTGAGNSTAVDLREDPFSRELQGQQFNTPQLNFSVQGMQSHSFLDKLAPTKENSNETNHKVKKGLVTDSSIIDTEKSRKEKNSYPTDQKFANRPRWYFRLGDKNENDQKRIAEPESYHKTSKPRWSNNRPQWNSSLKNPSSERDLAADDILTDATRYTNVSWKQENKGIVTELKKDDRRVSVSMKYDLQRTPWKSKKKTKRLPVKGCVGCSRYGTDIEQAAELHKQILKSQLLDKLRLIPTFKTQPSPPKLPDQVFPNHPQKDHWGYEDQYYAKPTQMLIFGEDLGPQHRLRKVGTGSYQFKVTGKVKNDFASAFLWVYKMKDAQDIHGQTFVVTELNYGKRRRLRERSLIARLDTHVQEGWLNFDVTRLVQRWLTSKTPASLQMLAIRCKTCQRTNYRAIFGVKSNFRPVLVVQEPGGGDKIREKRTACDPYSRCCKFDLTVHFRELGIHEIFYPRSIKADYCYGTCERPDAYYYNHTLIMQYMRFGSSATVNDTMRHRLQPCCVPVVLREASLMYYLNEGLDTRVSIVPNLLVEKCGCA